MRHGKIVVVVRIHMRPSVQDFIVKMRAGRFSGIARRADELAPLDHIAHLDIYLIHVGVSCLVSEPVVDYKVLSVAVAFELYFHYHTVRSGIDRIADMAGDRTFTVHPELDIL